MSKHQKKGGLPRYVKLFHWMLKSEAWKDLSAPARAIYIELERRYNGSNNGMIHYSAREAARDVKVSKGTAARGLRELQQYGFIVVEKMGAFHLKIRHASEYRLTIYDSNIEGLSVAEKLASKEFMRWPEIQNTVPPVRPTGRVVIPFGTPSDTVTSKKSPDGTRSDTVKAGLRR
jgi:hypothetical protein